MSDLDLEKIAHRVASGTSGKVRTAGKIEFVKDTGPIRRDIRVQGFDFSPAALRNLAKILWASQRAHSYALAATRLFSKMPSSQFSPDGLLGGRGYIQSIKDMRTTMSQATEVLSAFTDTLFDEINGDHWQSGQKQEGDVTGIVQDAEKVKENPENFVESEFHSEEDESFDDPIENPNPEELNPQFNSPKSESDWDAEQESEENEQQVQTAGSYAETAQREKRIKKHQKGAQEDPEKTGSKLPGGTGPQGEGISIPEQVMKTTLSPQGSYASSINRILRRHEMRLKERTASSRTADSSIPTDTLPGPRIDHIGPAEGNEAGNYNDGEEWASDDPAGKDLAGGVNITQPIYEDWCADGTTGYDNVTDGDNSPFHMSSKVAALPQTYSWLPGADNSKNLDYYALGLQEDDIEWMRQHAAPDPPPGLYPKKAKPYVSDLWEANF